MCYGVSCKKAHHSKGGKILRAWLYYRLSRDEDEELNSLHNQRKIIYGYAEDKGFEIVGESFDDNVSGMHFEREGIDRIYEAVDEGLIDCIVVKDLSRLGRHRTQTALFIDYLREHNVRVLSATENIDTFNENDDLIIGFKGLVNDFYARDGSRRVRAGYRQKQKEGIVTIPPFGYYKDKNTKKVVVVEKAAEIVRKIYCLYTSGNGMKSIARKLNGENLPTPALMQRELLGKKMCQRNEDIGKKYLWCGTMVKRILIDESYTGTLICHKTEKNKINKTFKVVDKEDQFRHENYYPQIISRELWEEAQLLIDEHKRKNIRAAPKSPILRYSGLIYCKDCGRVFVGKRKKLKNGVRVEYCCDTYHRYGKEYCSSHTIDEEALDLFIYNELKNTKESYRKNWESLEFMIDKWTPDFAAAEKKIAEKEQRIENIEDEVGEILMERIKDKANAKRYDRMIEKREQEIENCKKQIAELKNISQTMRKRQQTLKRDIRLLDDILSEETLSETHLRMLIDKILVHEENKKLTLDIYLKAPFDDHLNLLEDGEEVDYIPIDDEKHWKETCRMWGYEV